ncbi:MAG TPA: thioesterase family protein [Candidatus Deferrimicrobium sp.]
MSELPVTYRGVTYPWQCDHMNHMNVMWYVGKFDEATWNLFSMIGLTPSYFREKQCGLAAVQQNITYKRELHPGDVIVIRSEILEVKEKMIRFLHEMRKEETQEIAATSELISVHIDTSLRKSCPLPKEVIERARGMIAGG